MNWAKYSEVENLIDEIPFESNVAGKQKREEKCGGAFRSWIRCTRSSLSLWQSRQLVGTPADEMHNCRPHGMPHTRTHLSTEQRQLLLSLA